MKYLYIVACVYALSLSGCVFDCESYLNDEIRPLIISGVVINKYKESPGCFGAIVLASKNKLDTLSGICYCVMSNTQDLWKNVEVGDSLYKAASNLIVEVHRKDTIKKFEYPCCSQ
jgi:hypothetical protein